jgi:hypothetical protein
MFGLIPSPVTRNGSQEAHLEIPRNPLLAARGAERARRLARRLSRPCPESARKALFAQRAAA